MEASRLRVELQRVIARKEEINKRLKGREEELFCLLQRMQCMNTQQEKANANMQQQKELLHRYRTYIFFLEKIIKDLKTHILTEAKNAVPQRQNYNNHISSFSSSPQLTPKNNKYIKYNKGGAPKGPSFGGGTQGAPKGAPTGASKGAPKGVSLRLGPSSLDAGGGTGAPITANIEGEEEILGGPRGPPWGDEGPAYAVSVAEQIRNNEQNSRSSSNSSSSSRTRRRGSGCTSPKFKDEKFNVRLESGNDWGGLCTPWGVHTPQEREQQREEEKEDEEENQSMRELQRLIAKAADEIKATLSVARRGKKKRENSSKFNLLQTNQQENATTTAGAAAGAAASAAAGAAASSSPRIEAAAEEILLNSPLKKCSTIESSPRGVQTPDYLKGVEETATDLDIDFLLCEEFAAAAAAAAAGKECSRGFGASLGLKRSRMQTFKEENAAKNLKKEIAVLFPKAFERLAKRGMIK